METSLHQQLKEHYALSAEQIEVPLGDFRIDVIRGDELLEIQCASLSAIRAKIKKLLAQSHRVRVIKPLASRIKIAYVKKRDGKVTPGRWSPKRGHLADVFEELIYFRDVFPHPNLVLEFPEVEVEQHRIRSKKRKRSWRDPGYKVADTRLLKMIHRTEVNQPEDLWSLLPSIRWETKRIKSNRMPLEFNTEDLARHASCERWIAQRIAYVMRHSHAITQIGRDRNGVRYQRVDATGAERRQSA